MNLIGYTVHLPPVDVDRVYFERTEDDRFIQKDIAEETNPK